MERVFTFGFTGWRTFDDGKPKHQARPFRCPQCKREVYPQNLTDIACECGAEGNKQHFSSVEKKAA
jgi:hypothetical protein